MLAIPSAAPGAPATSRVAIDLGDRGYEILIGRGLLADAAVWHGLPRADSAVVVSNPVVAGLYGGALRNATWQGPITLPSGTARGSIT